MKYKIFFTVFLPHAKGFTYAKIFEGTKEQANERAIRARGLIEKHYGMVGVDIFYSITEATLLDMGSENNGIPIRFFP